MSSRGFTLAGACLVAAGGLGLLLYQAGAPAAPRGRIDAGRAGVAPAPRIGYAVARDDLPREGVGLLAGDVLRYALRRDTLEDTLHLRVYRDDGACWLVGFELGHDAGEVLVRVRRDGRTDAPDFPDAMPIQTRLLWKDLLATWRVVLPADANATEWEATETDRLGERKVHYARADSGEILKRLPDGEARYLLAPFVREAKGEERRADATIRFALALRDRRWVDPATLSPKTRARLVIEAGAAREDPDAIRTTLQGLADAVAAGEDGVFAASRHADRLVELLDADGTAAGLLAERLRQCGEREARTLFLALGRATSTAALRTHLAFLDRADAVRALGLAANLPAEAEAKLVALQREGGPRAGDALVVLAQAGRRDPARYDRMRKLVEGAFGADRDPVAWLEAVGALRPKTLLVHVRETAIDDRPAVRAAAMYALARSGGSEAETLLRAAAREDEDAAVRAAAIEALVRRGGSGLRDDLRAIVANDASPDLRRRAAAHLEELDDG